MIVTILASVAVVAALLALGLSTSRLSAGLSAVAAAGFGGVAMMAAGFGSPGVVVVFGGVVAGLLALFAAGPQKKSNRSPRLVLKATGAAAGLTIGLALIATPQAGSDPAPAGNAMPLALVLAATSAAALAAALGRGERALLDRKGRR